MLPELLANLSLMRTPIGIVILAIVALVCLFNPIFLLKVAVAAIALSMAWDAIAYCARVLCATVVGKDDDDDDDNDHDADQPPQHPVHAAGFATVMN
jgi:hypothetical protein